MRRLDGRRGWTPGILAFALAVAWAGGVFAATLPYDDRPPLLVSQAAPADQPQATRLLEAEVRQDETHGGVLLALTGDGAFAYDVFSLSGPDRLVLDLPGVRAANVRSRLEVGDSHVVRVRIGQWLEEPPVTRVVVDLTAPVAWSVDRTGHGLALVLAAESAAMEPIAASAAVEQPAVEPQIETPPAVSGPEPVASVATEPDPVTAEEAGTPTGADPEPAIVAEPEPVAASEPEAPVDPQAERVFDRPVLEVGSASTTPSEPSTRPQVAPRPEPVPTALTTPTPAPAPVVDTPPAEVTEVAPAPSVPAVPAEAPAIAPAPAAYVTEVSDTPAAEPAGDAAASAWSRAEIDQVINDAARQTESAITAPAPAPVTTAEGDDQSAFLPDVETKTIEGRRKTYSGTPISLQLVDADIKQVFGLFHDISGLNFVLDPAVAGKVTIVVDDVPWDQALDLILQNNGLDMVLQGNVVRIAPVTKLAQEAAARNALRDAKELEGTPVTITRTLSYAKAKDVERVIRRVILSPKGRVMLDERTNSLIIRDIESRISATDALLTTLDAETPQVMIEARIVEVSRDFVKDLGIQWGFNADADPSLGTETNLDFPHRANARYALNLPRASTTSAFGLSVGNVLDSFTLDVTLDALETEGYARRLSAPKIATQNNETAEIEQGVRFPIVSTTATEIDVRFVAASLRLEVTPQITAEGTVVLELTVENNQPDFVNTVGEVPSINTQRAETKVMLPDGGTTVIGGIFTVNEGRSEVGVPWFRKLPGLGWLFRSRNTQTRNRELLIFITPRIIKSY